MDYLDYRKLLGIGYSNAEKVIVFKKRILNLLKNLKNLGDEQLSFKEYFDYCNTVGISVDDSEWTAPYIKVVQSLEWKELSFEEFIFRYVVFINCQNDSGYKEFKRSNFVEYVKKTLRETHIPFEVIEDEDGYFIFPQGAKELDEALVGQQLIWLVDYPETRKKFSEALKRYAASEDNNISDIADDFRKSLETFFQEFFDADKSLEHMNKMYGQYLKEKGIQKELENNLCTLLKAYETFMNNCAKHHDRTDAKVLEYLMYETGNIIRLLIVLKIHIGNTEEAIFE